ncbi:MAG: hypothetical protein ACK58T_00735, partial [Phycisphaerae bacterium]
MPATRPVPSKGPSKGRSKGVRALKRGVPGAGGGGSGGSGGAERWQSKDLIGLQGVSAAQI